MLVSLTVGKVDAGVAVLLTEDKRLIEFPSILLPPDIHSGSIVDINVSRNLSAEEHSTQQFLALQEDLFRSFGQKTPSAPVLRCRNATQTSVVLEWDPIELATAELRSLSLWRNGNKVGVIPEGKLSTKISGLSMDTEYTFHLVLRTSAGMFTSDRLPVRTHKLTDLTGITITPGILPSPLRNALEETVHKIGAKLIDTVRIDTTHLVCTEPAGENWKKAVEMNLPVVVPDWVIGCQREGKVVGVRGYYLGEDPKLRQIGASTVGQGQGSRLSVGTVNSQVQGSPRIEHTPPTPERTTREHRGDEEREVEKSAKDGEVEARSDETERKPSAAEDEEDESEDDEDKDDAEPESRKSEALPERPATSQLPADEDEDEDAEEERTEDRAENGDGKFDEVAL